MLGARSEKFVVQNTESLLINFYEALLSIIEPR